MRTGELRCRRLRGPGAVLVLVLRLLSVLVAEEIVALPTAVLVCCLLHLFDTCKRSDQTQTEKRHSLQ